ncbi:hypothetical protein ABZ128_00455 [Streptomyces sp. NPDC006326]|uniref:hypothetical protein n=1 Tax=Streptomyces sp. NPDC006326 TaxID=3156752 RepID=UPI0033B5D836
MADERNRWLDRAAAERVLRGGPLAPVADHDAREAEARLRDALDSLRVPPARPGEQLPGEAAAVAAFRAARGGTPATAADAAGFDEPLVDLGTVLPAPVPVRAFGSGRSRPVRFGLVAALAGVAVGGLAAAAGAGLLDRVTHDSAGPAPAVSLSADEDPQPSGDVTGPSPGPQLRPTPLRDGFAPSPGAPATLGPDGNTWTGSGTGNGAGTGTGSGSSPGSAAGGTAGKDKFSGATDGLRDSDKENRLKAVDLCEAYRAGHMDADRRERLSKLAKGLARIPHYCEALLDAPAAPRSSGDGSIILKAPRVASPSASPSPGSPSAGLRLPR